MLYTYRGEQRDVTKAPRPETAPEDFDTSKCGTYAGYHRHRRKEVPPCPACHEANRLYTVQLRAARKIAA